VTRQAAGRPLRFLLLALLAACGHSGAPTTPTAPALAPDDVALGKRVDETLDRAITEQKIVGAVIIVARNGNVIYRRAAGAADRESNKPVAMDTIFRWASMTKPVVSAAAMALVDQGKLSLDDPVTKHLPDFRPKLTDGREPVITVRHLITHTSGLTYTFLEAPDGPYHKAGVSDGLAEPARSWEDNERRLASAPLLFEPGSKWNYGLSTDVLGAVVAKAGGASLPEVVKKTVTEPLGMTDAGFTVAEGERDRVAWPHADGVPPKRMTDPYVMPMGGLSIPFAPSRLFDTSSFPSGGAGMAGTADDYLRFAEAIRKGGSPILRAETTRAMTRNQIGDLELMMSPGVRFGYGFGVLVDPAAAKSPLGAGSYNWAGAYGSTFWIDPGAGLTVVVMTNTAGAMMFGMEIERAVYGTPPPTETGTGESTSQ
jgi:CubicO group peptidase (beta-lactamase class C family)